MAYAAAAAGLLLLGFAAAWPLLGRLDNRLEADMPAHPEPSLPARVRHWLGLGQIDQHLRRIEDTMAKVIDLLNGLVAQNTAASAAQATSFHNIDLAFVKLQQALANQDEADPEVQAAVDSLSAGFASLQKAAEDEGKLYEPADDNGGDTPPVDNGGDTGDVPAAD